MAPPDSEALSHLTAQDPISHCFIDSRIEDGGWRWWGTANEIWGFFDGRDLLSAVYVGANVVPVATTPSARAAFADRLRTMPRRSSSFVGPAQEVLDLWRLLEPAWGSAREVRENQPLLAIDEKPAIEGDPRVRVATTADFDALLPASIAMFTEEVGVSPMIGGGSDGYRNRVFELARAGRTYVLMDSDGVAFKAEVGSLSSKACQIQGVWVRPNLRGGGLCRQALARVVSLALQAVAPCVCLYVNSYNTPALKCYQSIGFRPHGRFATVLL